MCEKLLTLPGLHLLLGADLERGRDIRRGWQAILASDLRPRVESCTFKVAHHGSENADLDGIWTDLVMANSRAVLTPYTPGVTPRPSKTDIARLKSRTKYLYCTCWPPFASPPKR